MGCIKHLDIADVSYRCDDPPPGRWCWSQWPSPRAASSGACSSSSVPPSPPPSCSRQSRWRPHTWSSSSAAQHWYRSGDVKYWVFSISLLKNIHTFVTILVCPRTAVCSTSPLVLGVFSMGYDWVWPPGTCWWGWCHQIWADGIKAWKVWIDRYLWKCHTTFNLVSSIQYSN